MESKTLVNLAFDSVGPEDFVIIDGGKPPIIFLHGMTSDRSTWKNVIRPIAVATGRKAYAFDARNHGDSGWSEEMSYEIMQEDLLHFMDGLPAPKAILIGHSMGGKTAMFFAARKAERVEKLIVEDISPKPAKPDARAMVLKYMELMKSAVEKIPPEVKSLEEAKKFVYDFSQPIIRSQEDQSSRHASTDGSSLPLCQGENGKFRWKANLKAIEDSMMTHPSTEIKGPCQSPTLLIYGTKSPYKVSSDRDFIRSIFPSCQFRAVEGASHQIHDGYEEIFVKEVTEFINDSS